MDGKYQSDKQKIMAIYDQLPDEVRTYIQRRNISTSLHELVIIKNKCKMVSGKKMVDELNKYDEFNELLRGMIT